MFAYLGMAFFSFKLIVKPAFAIWSIVSACSTIFMLICEKSSKESLYHMFYENGDYYHLHYQACSGSMEA